MGVSRERTERVKSLLRDIVSSFIKTRIDESMIISVMRVEVSGDLERAKIFISVFPEEKEGFVLKETKRLTPDLYKHLKKQIRSFLPRISFEIDKEIKIQRKLEEILGDDKKRV